LNVKRRDAVPQKIIKFVFAIFSFFPLQRPRFAHAASLQASPTTTAHKFIKFVSGFFCFFPPVGRFAPGRRREHPDTFPSPPFHRNCIASPAPIEAKQARRIELRIGRV
jgi:hypothetical protein